MLYLERASFWLLREVQEWLAFETRAVVLQHYSAEQNIQASNEKPPRTADVSHCGGGDGRLAASSEAWQKLERL